MLNPDQQHSDLLLLQLAEALELALGGFNEAFFGRPIPDDAASAVEAALAALAQLPSTATIQQKPAPPPGERRPQKETIGHDSP